MLLNNNGHCSVLENKHMYIWFCRVDIFFLCNFKKSIRVFETLLI